MKKIVESISEQAAHWVMREDAGSLASDERRELDIWLNADSRRLGAYVRARALWVDLDRLAALNGPMPFAATATRGRRGMSRRELLAAGIAAATAVGGGLFWISRHRDGTFYTSGIGEVRRITLADGSTMLLNTATDVAVEFNERQRVIRLIRGEALFEVAHDKSWPFVVRAHDAAVRAVGTAFAVRLEDKAVEVTVTEGVVEVADSTAAPAADQHTPLAVRRRPIRVAANERLVATQSHSAVIQAVAPAEVDRQLAWLEGMVSFDGESLQTAVSEINRHNRRQIVVTDPTLAAKPVVGVFRATDLDGFADAAAIALKAKAVRDGDIIRLEPGGGIIVNPPSARASGELN